jgi:creatinine amidohydrolase/Fe(II)-dependent formamide hydrolase-like protein
MNALACTWILALLPSLAVAQVPSVFIADLTWTEVRDAIAAGKTTALYYAGSTEQNGPGVALGKHTFVAHYVAQRIAEALGNALVYPIMPYAPTGDPRTKTGHMAFPGTVSVSEATYGAVAREVVQSAIAAGFTHVALMGDHGGGQRTLKQVAEALHAAASPKGIHVSYIPDLYYKTQAQRQAYLTQRQMALDEHAGLADTSEMLFIDTEHQWVRTEKLAPDQGALGVRGDPTQASPALGEMFLGFKITNAVTQIRRLTADKR